MKTLTLETRFGTKEEVELTIDSYHNSRCLFLGLTTNEEGFYEPYGDISVNLNDNAPDYCAYVDTNNMPELEKFLEDNEIGYFTGMVKQSGFCTYPLYMFNIDKLRELCPYGLERYEKVINKNRNTHISKEITITCEWSESNYFESKKTYSVFEFDTLMKKANMEMREGKEKAISHFGSEKKWYENNEVSEYDKYKGYNKTKFTINYPTGEEYTERMDVGDEVDGVIDYCRTFLTPKWNRIALKLEDQLKKDIENGVFLHIRESCDKDATFKDFKIEALNPEHSLSLTPGFNYTVEEVVDGENRGRGIYAADITDIQQYIVRQSMPAEVSKGKEEERLDDMISKLKIKEEPKNREVKL